MKKKVYMQAPMIYVFEVKPQSMMEGSNTTATIDGQETIVYDSTPGDASGGLSRQGHNLWEDEGEERLY